MGKDRGDMIAFYEAVAKLQQAKDSKAHNALPGTPAQAVSAESAPAAVRVQSGDKATPVTHQKKSRYFRSTPQYSVAPKDGAFKENRFGHNRPEQTTRPEARDYTSTARRLLAAIIAEQNGRRFTVASLREAFAETPAFLRLLGSVNVSQNFNYLITNGWIEEVGDDEYEVSDLGLKIIEDFAHSSERKRKK